MPIEHINPQGMHKSPVFSQGIIIPPGCRTLLIGGQNGVDEQGQVVDRTSLGAQSAKAIENLVTVLSAAGAELEDLVSVSIYMKHGEDIGPGFAAWMQVWGNRTNPPVVKAVTVAGFPNPDVLIEIEAVAVFK